MLLLWLLQLLGLLHNLPPSRNRHQAVQGHLLAVHVHLVDDWQAAGGHGYGILTPILVDLTLQMISECPIW